jgi:Fe-S-cluster containining protein
MESLETELDRARDLDVAALADAIESIGFECTRCGACCKAVDGCGDEDGHDHVATVFPDEVRRLQRAAAEREDGDGSGEDNGDGTGEPYDWRDVARPMPYGLTDGPDGPEGETFEWALRTDDCGDCRFYAEDESETGEGGPGRCTVHADRPLVCRTYPFSIGDVDERQHSEGGGLGTTEPMGGVVEQEGMVRAHECEGLGRGISREDAEELAAALKERAVQELEEAIGVRDNYEPTDVDGVVVHDSEGQKQPDGTLVRDEG